MSAWRISNTGDFYFYFEALEGALGKGSPNIFNTGQGAQVASDKFAAYYRKMESISAWTGKGRFMDNIFVDRPWRSLKYEETYLKAYEADAEANAR